MPLAFTPSSLPRRVGNAIIVVGRIVASGAYVAGGDTLDLSQIPGLPTQQVPDNADIVSNAAPNSGWEYGFVNGANLSNGKMQVLGQSGNQGAATVLTELAAGAYPASVTGDVINAILTFLSMGS